MKAALRTLQQRASDPQWFRFSPSASKLGPPITIRLPREIDQSEFAAAAARKGVPVAVFIREIVVKHWKNA